MKINLRENILEYRETKDKDILERLYLYFEPYLYNISQKIYSEYGRSDMDIGFIEIVNNLNLKQDSDQVIKKKIVTSLKNKKIDIIRKNINHNHLKTCSFDELSESLKDNSIIDYSQILTFQSDDLIKVLTEKQREVIVHSIFLEEKDVEIASKMCIKKQSVGDLKRRALKRMKKYIERNELNGQRSI